MNNETNASTPNSEYRVELFVRSLAPTGAHERQRAIIDRLVQLAEENRIGTISSTVWGDRICPETASKLTTGRSLLDDFDRLRTWAHQHDASLEPFFDERVEGSMFEDTHTVVIPPVLCLAVSKGDGLWGVFPCTNGDEIYTVMDGLDMLDDIENLPLNPFMGQVEVQL